MQILEIGSLKNITVVPQQFPNSLKGVILHEVPKNLVNPFAERLAQLGISQVWMDVWHQKPQESASQKSQLVSAITEQQFRQAMILVLQNRTGTLLSNQER